MKRTAALLANVLLFGFAGAAGVALGLLYLRAAPAETDPHGPASAAVYGLAARNSEPELRQVPRDQTMRDPKVRAARFLQDPQENVPAEDAPAGGAPAEEDEPTLSVEQVRDISATADRRVLVWDKPRADRTLWLRGNVVQFLAKSDPALPAGRFGLLRNGNETIALDGVPADSTGTVTIQTQPLDPGLYDLQVVVTDDANKPPVRSETIRIVVPRLNAPPSPLIQQAFTGPHAPPSDIDSVVLYGSYLRLHGHLAAPAGAGMELYVVAFGNGENGEGVALLPAPLKAVEMLVEATGAWRATFQLPLSFGQAGKLYVVAAQAGAGAPRHQYSATPITFAMQPPDSLPAPTGLDVLVAGDAGTDVNQDPIGDAYRLRIRTFKIAGQVNPPANSYVLVFRAGSPIPVGAAVPFTSAVPNGSAFTTEITVPDIDADYTFSAVLMQGARSSPHSEPVRISVRRVGPVVDDLDARLFSLTPEVRTIAVRFSAENPLKPVNEATLKGYFSVRNMSLIAVAPGDASVLQTIGVERAGYDPQTNTVTLTLDARAVQPGKYELAISTGLRDIYGNPLGSTPTDTDGEPYRAEIPKMVDAGIPLGAPGLPGQTGPFVPFPEYTDPREYPDGFNPSDKVVSRVARLYYFRDAHRVVQIVNRKARSWNRHTVDMQHQIADRARDLAEDAIDRRRAEEMQAVRAAQEAHQAEALLAQFQQALVQAREQEARVQAQQRALELEIADMEDELEDAKAAAKARADAEAAAAQAQADAAAAGTPAPPLPPLPPAPTPAEIDRMEDRLRQARLRSTQLAAAVSAAATEVQTAEQRVTVALGKVQAARSQEMKASEQWEAAEAREARAVATQFRREVAAAHADPDTYAPALPISNDPVEQVSLSVIGEGVIHLRGPLKGVNTVRTMINQIDAPVGQVRVGIHTIQVNGERGERMEPVVARIQRYVDHSRFLTVRSAQMLRNSVVLVASRRAEQAAFECPGQSQTVRDRKYLESFFGADFIAELAEMDSEFLDTGNKLLSLHSMDSTSLASALFVMALAKNSTRMEILQEFDRMVQTQLPVEEQEYFMASGAEERFRCREFQFFAQNARFVSFKGFFSNEVFGDDTLTPIQREFIRLAQIFKSRLVTEIEWQQRVMERALIEERLGNYMRELRLARRKEGLAEVALAELRAELRDGQAVVFRAASTVAGYAGTVQKDAQGAASVGAASRAAIRQLWSDVFGEYIRGATEEEQRRVTQKLASWTSQLQGALSTYDQEKLVETLFEARNALASLLDNEDLGNTPVLFALRYRGKQIDLEVTRTGEVHFRTDSAELQRTFRNELMSMLQLAKEIQGRLAPFRLGAPGDLQFEQANKLIEAVDRSVAAGHLVEDSLTNLFRIAQAMDIYATFGQQVASEAGSIAAALQSLVGRLSDPSPDVLAIHRAWLSIRTEILEHVNVPLRSEVEPLIRAVDSGFSDLLEVRLRLEFAQLAAKESRRPLDHKKMLDMLVDDVEEKFIELVEGTRAHTAVVDAYIGRIATALDDDLNTQFYEPAFRQVREVSQYWDVQLGQVEHTNILTNNRMFAKVSPQATMEFDLPKRRIVIAEAMQAAKAAYADYGALMADPNFLALTKLHSGQPTASAFGGAGPHPPVRDVLPGLPSSTDERLLMQAPAGSPEFASQLEGLIPDPAIYKFETGTGFEIRPVIQPDGQAVVFHLNYMYTTNVREPVRADEKHLGRVKRHFIDTDVQLANYELREVSRYRVALKASRTARGVPLLEDVPGVGVLFRPMPQQESSLQENIILAQATIFPTLFDLMGLRWAPAVADLDTLGLRELEFVTRKRRKYVRDQVFDYASSQVDDFMRIPQVERRPDLYRTQETIPFGHPNGYAGPGLNLQDSHLREGFDPRMIRPEGHYAPGETDDLAPLVPMVVPPGAMPPGIPLPPTIEGLPPFDPSAPVSPSEVPMMVFPPDAGPPGTQVPMEGLPTLDPSCPVAPPALPLEHSTPYGLGPAPMDPAVSNSRDRRSTGLIMPAGMSEVRTGKETPSRPQGSATVQAKHEEADEQKAKRWFRLPSLSRPK